MPMPRKTVFMIPPAALAKRIVAATTERDTQQNVLDALLGNGGIDLTSENATAYLDKLVATIAAADKVVHECMLELFALAKEGGGYDPNSCTCINVDDLETNSAVRWTVAVKDEGAA